VTTIYDAAMQYKNEGTALVVIAGKESDPDPHAIGPQKGRCCWA
jgi:hypothetical protein